MELTLFVDHACNLRCAYCYTGDKFSRPMSTTTMRKAVALALAATPDRLGVSFFGGEPLLRLDFLQETVAHVEQCVAALAHPIPIRFFLNTNATLVDDRAIAWMTGAHDFEVFASLDGDEQVHDRHRRAANGRGSHAAVLAGVTKLRDAGLPLDLLSVVSPSTAGEVGRTVRALLEIGARKLHLAADYSAEWTDREIAELAEGLEEAGNAWMNHFRAGHAIALEPLHAKILSHLKGGMPCPSRCLLGGHEWAVSPQGTIYPCAQMVGEDTRTHLAIGHVDQGIDLAALMRLQRAKDRVEQTCAECALRDRCQSHCGCRHLALSGELGVITATLCEIEAAFIAAADRVAETLYGEQCPAFLEFYYHRRWRAAPGGMLTDLRRAPDS